MAEQAVVKKKGFARIADYFKGVDYYKELIRLQEER